MWNPKRCLLFFRDWAFDFGRMITWPGLSELLRLRTNSRTQLFGSGNSRVQQYVFPNSKSRKLSGQCNEQFHVRRCVPAEAARGDVGGADETLLAVRIVFGVEVRVDKKSPAFYLRHVVEDSEVASARRDIFRQPACDTDAFRNWGMSRLMLKPA